MKFLLLFFLLLPIGVSYTETNFVLDFLEIKDQKDFVEVIYDDRTTWLTLFISRYMKKFSAPSFYVLPFHLSGQNRVTLMSHGLDILDDKDEKKFDKFIISGSTLSIVLSDGHLIDFFNFIKYNSSENEIILFVSFKILDQSYQSLSFSDDAFNKNFIVGLIEFFGYKHTATYWPDTYQYRNNFYMILKFITD